MISFQLFFRIFSDFFNVFQFFFTIFWIFKHFLSFQKFDFFYFSIFFYYYFLVSTGLTFKSSSCHFFLLNFHFMSPFPQITRFFKFLARVSYLLLSSSNFDKILPICHIYIYISIIDYFSDYFWLFLIIFFFDFFGFFPIFSDFFNIFQHFLLFNLFSILFLREHWTYI